PDQLRKERGQKHAVDDARAELSALRIVDIDVQRACVAGQRREIQRVLPRKRPLDLERLAFAYLRERELRGIRRCGRSGHGATRDSMVKPWPPRPEPHPGTKPCSRFR